MRIDDHNHPDWHGRDLDAFLKNMDDNEIDITWLLSWECPETEFDPGAQWAYYPHNGSPMPFERCLSYKERAPRRFVLGYCPDPRDPKAIDKLKSAVKMYDVKVCGELKLRMMLDDWDAIRMYRYCGEAGLPVLVHLDYEYDRKTSYPRPNYWYGGGMDAFERAIAKCPETTFIGHAPGFWCHISNDDKGLTEAYPKGKVIPGGKIEQMLEKYPNMYCDMSAGSGCNAFSRDPEFAREFLIKWQDRILYGRDYFDDVHRKFLDSINLPKEVEDKIYYKNALKLVPLNLEDYDIKF
jgi:predicted TIM-barrel fold metal-dependent hydrolase